MVRILLNAEKAERGSSTLEAALVLPLFLCVVLMFAFFIKTVYIHAVVQHAITETAGELASTGYLYYASGLMEKVEEGEGKIKEEINNTLSVSTFLDYLGEAGEDILSGLHPEFESIMGSAADAAVDQVKSRVFQPLAYLYMKKYLETNKISSSLNIMGGYEGLSLKGSKFFENGDIIEIVVSYTIRVPLPPGILSEIKMKQRAVSRAWLYGDERLGRLEEDIWSLANLIRGRKVREIMKANLPWSFPGISSFKNGTATLIRSMDLTAASYRNEKNVRDKLYEYIDSLESYRGQPEPWNGIVIKESEIKNRVFILIIPRNQADPEINNAIDRCRKYALDRGVRMVVRKYGIKRT